MSYIIQCDRCSKTGGQGSINHLPQGWRGIALYVKVAGTMRYNWHQFCPECTGHLQIESEPTEETSAERLVAILESMVKEAVDERGCD